MDGAQLGVPSELEARGWNLVGGPEQSPSSDLKGPCSPRMDGTQLRVPSELEARGQNLVEGPEQSQNSSLEGNMLTKHGQISAGSAIGT